MVVGVLPRRMPGARRLSRQLGAAGFATVGPESVPLGTAGPKKAKLNFAAYPTLRHSVVGPIVGPRPPQARPCRRAPAVQADASNVTAIPF
jgi:hypothetical protein